MQKQRTPSQAALRQLVVGALCTAIMAGAAAIFPLINGAPDWRVVGIVFAIAALVSLIHSAFAYFEAVDPSSAGEMTPLVQAGETWLTQEMQQAAAGHLFAPVANPPTMSSEPLFGTGALTLNNPGFSGPTPVSGRLTGVLTSSVSQQPVTTEPIHAATTLPETPAMPKQ